MTLMSVIEASAIGRAHRRAGRGGQDASASAAAGGIAAAAVADGCSAGARSEIGAGVGARFVVADAIRRARMGAPLAELPAIVMADLVEELARLARVLAVDESELTRVVEAHLLFTVQCAVVAGERAIVFGVGDGVISIDGDARVLEGGAAPDCPVYALFEGLGGRVVVHHHGSFARTIALGTDGAAELIAQADTPLADGTALGGLRGFEDDARYLKNKSLAQKRFHAWCDRGGPVDDCTVVVLKRGAP